MNAERNTAEFTRQTVLNFRFLDAAAMGALRTDLSLSLSDAALFHCREHFRLREGRDPTIRELLFLNAYALAWARRPDTATVRELIGTEEDARIFADMKKKQATMRAEQVPCGDTLLEWAELTGRYLSRSGIPPYHDHLACGHVNELAARTSPSGATQEDVQTTAALLSPTVSHPYARNIILLFPSGNQEFPREIVQFMKLFAARGVEPLAAPCNEGMLPHLLALGHGLLLDTLSLPVQSPEIDPSAILTAGKGALLLLATDEAMPYLLSQGLPIVVCGCTQPGDRLILRHGNEITLSLSTALLPKLHHTAPVPLSLPTRTPVATPPSVLSQNSCLMGRVTAQSGCEAALLGLIGELRTQGADPRRMTLTAVWETPHLAVGRQALAEAMLSVLDHHRVCAELSLPSHHHKHLVQAALDRPRVTLFAMAEKSTPPGNDFAAQWEFAAAKRDFATLRSLLYSTN